MVDSRPQLYKKRGLEEQHRRVSKRQLADGILRLVKHLCLLYVRKLATVHMERP